MAKQGVQVRKVINTVTGEEFEMTKATWDLLGADGRRDLKEVTEKPSEVQNATSNKK